MLKDRVEVLNGYGPRLEDPIFDDWGQDADTQLRAVGMRIHALRLAGGSEFYLRLWSDYDGSTEFRLHYKSPETESETRLREASEAELRAVNERVERGQLAALKAKYESVAGSSQSATATNPATVPNPAANEN